MDMEPIACTATCDQRSIFQGKGEKHNSPNTQPYPADESEDDKGHVPRVAVYVDGDIPEYGEQSCSNDVNKQHCEDGTLVVLLKGMARVVRNTKC